MKHNTIVKAGDIAYNYYLGKITLEQAKELCEVIVTLVLKIQIGI